jgi:hypothetical protein
MSKLPLSLRGWSLPLLALVVVAAMLAAPARAAEPEAKALLESIYAAYIGEESAGLWFETEADAARVFTPELAALHGADLKAAEETGDIGRLDFDPFINGQDWAVENVDIAVEDTGSGTAVGEARFNNFDAANVVRYDLVKTADGWRIDDIHWDAYEYSLRDILQGVVE